MRLHKLSGWMLAWAALAMLLATVLSAVPALAQSDEPPAATDAAADDASAEPAEPDAAGAATDFGAMVGDEGILAGSAYSYDPGDRRDPFKSLLVVTDRPTLEGPRPDGIPGLLIDEVVLSGIFATRNGYVAQVQAADQQKSYLIRVGDELYDGVVVDITRSEVIFKQDVQDPTELKPFREVTKSLKP
jgi:hypothetical protein